MNVGESWADVRGRVEIAAFDGDFALLREECCPRVLYRVRTEELPRMREIAAANLEYRDRVQKAEAEAEAREAEARSLDGWESELSPLECGRVKACLTREVRYRGRAISYRDLIRLVVSEGAVPGDGRMEWPDGRFVRVPKTATRYADFILRKPL